MLKNTEKTQILMCDVRALEGEGWRNSKDGRVDEDILV